MLAEITRGDDFAALHRYLTGEVKKLGPDDIELRNLVSIETAVAEMRLAASRSIKTEMPVYHLILTWAEEEHPTRDQQFAMAHDLIGRIGLGDHQAVLVRHTEAKGGATPGAGRHHELHINLNRVGPTGRAAAMSHDYAVVERAVATIAEEHRMRVVPGRHNGVIPDGIFQGGSGAARSYTAATGELTVAGAIRNDPEKMARLVAARTQGWPALLKAFEDAGVQVTQSTRMARKGQSTGLVLVSRADPTRVEKISALDGDGLKWGRPSLEKELGPLPVQHLTGMDISQAVIPPAASNQASSRRPHAYEAFQAARAAAFARRGGISDQHGRAMAALRSRHQHAREAIEKAAVQRRQLSKAFFGRGSQVGGALNFVLDHRFDERRKALRLSQRNELAALRAKHCDELAQEAVPVWRDWQRCHDDRNGGPEIDRSPQAPKRETGSKGDPQPAQNASVSNENDLAERVIIEEQRRERLLRNREDAKSRRRRKLLDTPSVTMLAGITHDYTAGRIRRRVLIRIIVVMAAANAVAPLLLAMAAFQLARVVEAQGRARMRADIDAAKAARSGFAFTSIPKADRVRYARLTRSDLFIDGGPQARPLLDKMDDAAVARFIAWYAHASDRQRAVVGSWGKARSPVRRRDTSGHERA